MVPWPLLAAALLLAPAAAEEESPSRRQARELFLAGESLAAFQPSGAPGPEPALEDALSVQRGRRGGEPQLDFLRRVVRAAEGLGADAEGVRIALRLYGARGERDGADDAPPAYVRRVSTLLQDPFAPRAGVPPPVAAAGRPFPESPAMPAPRPRLSLWGEQPPPLTSMADERLRLSPELPEPAAAPANRAERTVYRLAEAGVEKTMFYLGRQAGYSFEEVKGRDLEALAGELARTLWRQWRPNDIAPPSLAGSVAGPAASIGDSGTPPPALGYRFSLQDLYKPRVALDGKAFGLSSHWTGTLDPATLKTDARFTLRPADAIEMQLRKDQQNALSVKTSYSPGPLGFSAGYDARIAGVEGLAGGLRYNGASMQLGLGVRGTGVVNLSARHQPTQQTSLQLETSHDPVNGAHDAMLRVIWPSVEAAVDELTRLFR